MHTNASCAVFCLLLSLRPLSGFGLANRGLGEPYNKTTTAWVHTVHDPPVLFHAALPSQPNSPSSHLTGSVLTAAERVAPVVLTICPLFRRY